MCGPLPRLSRVAGDGDLDEGLGIYDTFTHPPKPTLDQQFQIRRTPLVTAKTMPERVLHVPDLEPLGTPSVVSIQKRAVTGLVGHTRRAKAPR